MGINTPSGFVEAPKTIETKSLYAWLKKYRNSFGGSVAYGELIEVYEALDYDLNHDQNEQNKRHVG